MSDTLQDVSAPTSQTTYQICVIKVDRVIFRKIMAVFL
jgi:hypothetical protein